MKGLNFDGLLIVVFALFALYLYNTGRAQAVLSIIQGRAPGSQPYISSNSVPAPSGSGGGGGSSLGAIAGIVGSIASLF